MEVRQNVLYVLTQGSYLRRDHQTIQVEVEGRVRLGVPIHHLQAVALFGNVMVTPGAMQCCTEAGVSLTFHTESGRLLARVDGPVSGNVLLRREQFRKADQPSQVVKLSRMIVAGKLQNSRNSILRAGRDNAAADDHAELSKAAEEIASLLRRLESVENIDQIRGIEGAAARVYFGVFGAMVRHQRDSFRPQGRSRRPPLDRMNAMLSFIYALLLADCVGALTSAGLDCNVGYLHSDRPGKPSLALDLMEEFRPLLADRLALTLVNRRQIQPNDFEVREGGAVEIKENARRAVVSAWQERKQEEIVHPLLGQSTTVGLLMHLQGKILARTIRGDIESYVPYTPK
ncbi:MAG: type I-C CRISPR-associated endonuclease Cas1 [Bryobacterales bacterium]|nr:type I-C CRISPR-associated endonuclease Cas1 [Bryobacterales bacterium]